MSTSGINLSSLLSALGSSSSGINVSSAVAAAMQALSLPEQQWETEQTTLQTQTSDIDQIQTDVESLQTSLSALSDPAGALASMTATSSDTNVVQASAASGTAAGTHVVVVNNIASTASWYSSSVASSSTNLTPGSFTLQTGSGTATQIQIGSGVNTLDQLASYINTQNLGVTASVVNDSSGSRLAIVSNNSGAANGFTISNASGLTFTQASAGQDASLTVDGIPIDSASNTVTGAVNGLTLNLVGAAPGGQITVTVAPDSTQVSTAIATFVGAYNTAMGDVNTQYTVNAANQEGPLASDSSVQILQDSLLSIAGYSGGGNGISTLADLGITMNKDGTLSLDTATLTNAIQNNFSAVQNFMQGASSNGFASFINNQLNTLTEPGTGAFTVDLQSINSENSDLQNQINNFQTYLNTQQTLLTAEYNQADITLQEIPQEEAQINAELGYPPTTSTSS
ncbi:MAG: flagellar filament capping protein FliD [Candidatus Sulfotelmatobacter sp.]|jgi:flagellar hook-associated protein 2